MIEIPLTSSPEQLFSILIDGNNYDCRVILSSKTGIWSISFSQAGEDIVTGVPLLSGIDIMNQFNLPIHNAFIINLDAANQDPSKTNLGTSAKLFILTDEEVGNGSPI